MHRSSVLSLLLATVAYPATGQQRPLSPAVKQFVSVEDRVVAITNVRVVDGLASPPVEGQTVVVTDGKISAVGKTGSVTVPAGARTIDGSGKTVIPGLIGLHDHSYYTTSGRVAQSNFSAPLLYLASGVTTIRTTGANNPYAELNLRKSIESGEFPGPRIFITGPYITGAAGTGLGSSMVGVKNADEARRVVAYWAKEGVNWLKFYTAISRDAMKAAIDEAHKHGIKFTGHLCSVPYREAVAFGIDAIEHGLFANSDYDKTRKPDECSPNMSKSFASLDMNGPEVQATFRDMIAKNVPLTSTLVVFELFVPNRPAELDPRALEAMSPEAKSEYLASRQKISETPGAGIPLEVFKKGMEYERAFYKAGGILASGVDPTGNGGALFGFGDQRNVELLVEAGFSPVEAIQVATSNGAKALGIFNETGSIAVGKQADLALIAGNPAADIADIRKVELVFHGGLGFDSAKMIAAVKGLVGTR